MDLREHVKFTKQQTFDILFELDDKELKMGETWAMKRDRVTPALVKAMRKDKR